MLIKKVTYTDYNGEERTDTLYFNLNKSELMKWELSQQGGLKAKLEQIIESKDVPAIAQVFEEIISKSYGVKSPDGKRFIKSKELLDEFMQTEAYSELYMTLATNSDEANKFIKGILPKESALQPAT